MKFTESVAKRKILLASVGIVLSVVLLFSGELKVPGLDSATDNYFHEAMTEGGIVYGTCRLVNASVSIVKESSLQLEPAGVGVSLAVGQALDPIDDMTERLSDVVVTAIASLGVQKLAYEIGVSYAPPVLAFLLFIFSLLLLVEKVKLQALQRILIRYALLVVIARFCLPISSLANAYINIHFFAEEIADVRSELALDIAELDNLKEFALPEIDGVMKTIENSASFLKQKSLAYKHALLKILDNMSDIINNLLMLTSLYVGVIVIQVIVLPLLSFWFLGKTINALFQTNIPYILSYEGRSSEES